MTARLWPRLVSLLMLVLVACAEADPGTAEPAVAEAQQPAAEVVEPVRIGAVLDITGPGAALGGPQRDTLTLLAEQVNADGGIDGRPVEVLIVDNQSREDEAAVQTSRLLDEEDVDLLIGASRTGPSLAMKEIAEAEQVPLISLAAGDAITEGAKWVFKIPQDNAVVVERLIRHIETQGWSTVGILRDSSAFGEGIAEEFTRLGADRGVAVVAEERYDPAATDFTTQLVNLRAAAADANVIWGIPPAAANATHAYRQLGLDAPLLHSHGIGSDAFLQTAGESADGVVFPIGRLLVADELSDDDPQKELIEQFVAAFEEAYGETPTIFAGNAHDGFMLAVDAVRAVGTEKEAVRDYLETREGFVGVTAVFNFSPDNHSGVDVDSLALVEVVDGAWTLATE